MEERSTLDKKTKQFEKLFKKNETVIIQLYIWESISCPAFHFFVFVSALHATNISASPITAFYSVRSNVAFKCSRVMLRKIKSKRQWLLLLCSRAHHTNTNIHLLCFQAPNVRYISQLFFFSSVQSLNSCRGVYVSFDLRGFCYLSVFLTWLLHKHSALNFNLYGMRYAIRAALRVLTFCETHQPAVWRIHTSARNASDRMISPRVDWGWESTIFRFQFQFTICVRE